MPSGSRSGGGGSHRSSSSSGGSHRSSSSYSSGGSHRSSSYSNSSSNRNFSSGSYYNNSWHNNYGNDVYIFGSTRHFSNRNHNYGKLYGSIFMFLLSFLLIIVAFCTFVGQTIPNHNYLGDIKSDYNYYQNMISYAQQNPEYIIDAEITSVHYNYDFNKWYYKYKFKTSSGSYSYGETYSVYTSQEVTSEFRPGTQIKIAVNSVPVTTSTDSIPLEYRNTTLEDDGEYVLTKNKLSNSYLTIGIVLLFAGFAIYFGVLLAKKHVNKSTEKVEQTTSTNTITTEQKPSTWICAYCGNTNNNEKTKCSQCGAKKE